MNKTAPNLDGVTPSAIIAGQAIQQMLADSSGGCTPGEILKMADTPEQEIRLGFLVSDENKPEGWKRKLCLPDGALFEDKKGRRVIVSVMTYSDCRLWIHASISHTKSNKLPHYNEIAMLKKYWIGEDYKAIMVFPEKKYHVNINQNVLHLFSCLMENPLPEFSMGTGSI
jgi:hypothetical protein